MTVITSTRSAKCKDCIFCKRFSKGKLTRHKCSNPESGRKSITLNELVCDKWKL